MSSVKDLRNYVEKKLTTVKRKGLKDSDFALPDERKYPIHDRAHAHNALARGKQMLDKGKLSKSDYDKVVKAVCAKYPEFKTCKV